MGIVQPPNGPAPALALRRVSSLRFVGGGGHAGRDGSLVIVIDRMRSGVAAWVAGPGPESAAVARISVCASMLLVLRGLEEPAARIAAMPAELFRPVGIVRILPVELWTQGAVWTLRLAAFAAVALALVGLWSRTSFVVSYIATLYLVSLTYSWTGIWSHGEALTLLAGLPLLLTAHGDAWSLDARRRDERPRRDGLTAYGLPVRCLQLLVALYFLNAGYWKLTRTGLAWAWSENLRQILALRYGVLEFAPPALADLALRHGWLSRLLAVGNLVAQIAPIALVPFLGRRWARVSVAVLVTGEALGLTLVMGLFHGEMIPLGLVFLTGQPGRAPVQPVSSSAVRRTVALASVSLILTAQVTVAWLNDDAALRAFPLTSTSMFSAMYGPEAQRLRITTTPSLSEAESRRIRETATLPVGDQRCRLLQKLVIAIAEAEAAEGIAITSVRVDLETFNIAGGRAELLSAEHIETFSRRQLVTCDEGAPT